MSRLPRRCLDCGTLIPTGTRCATCRAIQQQPREQKKRELYHSGYKREAKALRDAGGICYLCGGWVGAGTGHADHVNASDPSSPLAITHPYCNQSRGDKPVDGGVW